MKKSPESLVAGLCFVSHLMCGELVNYKHVRAFMKVSKLFKRHTTTDLKMSVRFTRVFLDMSHGPGMPGMLKCLRCLVERLIHASRS
jgi:hypothetical protein